MTTPEKYTVRTEFVDSEDAKQFQSDTNKMVNCLNKMLSAISALNYEETK